MKQFNLLPAEILPEIFGGAELKKLQFNTNLLKEN